MTKMKMIDLKANIINYLKEEEDDDNCEVLS